MKQISISIICLFILGSCISSGTGDRKVYLEKRILDADVHFSDDEIEIYNYLIDVTLSNNQKRTIVTGDTTALNEKIMTGELKNADDVRKYLETLESISIKTDKIILHNATTIVGLSKEKTYKDNMELSKAGFQKKYGNMYDDLFDEFIAVNEFDYSLENHINTRDDILEYNNVENQIDETNGATDFWGKLYETIPDVCGIMRLSKIGFISNKAIVDVQFLRGSMNGFVDYIIFEKEDNWRVVDSFRHIYY
ncbi:MAG: hypothetical protein LBF83_03395 [Spirochaetaceae bacterium]|jgi:hypothetical protein|nr:hypothetical protein [Spirochaetaceae bacterium]